MADNTADIFKKIEEEIKAKGRSEDAINAKKRAFESTCTNLRMVGARAIVVRNLKTLNTPKEGGTKKEYESLLEKT